LRGQHQLDHALALALWDSSIHEARIVSALVDDPRQVTDAQLERQVGDLDSWDVCDQWCGSLVCATALAQQKVAAWSAREETFVKRAAFAVLAYLAHQKGRATDAELIGLLPLVEREASDGRNYVKKAVNWALRQVGKRNLELNAAAIACAERVHTAGSRSARWIASDALRELRSEDIQARLAPRG
jgi:3-methyladenine DNA glycosylase AlkD